jgi:hypothetical protein
MRLTHIRAVFGWAIAGAVCLLSLLCPWPAHASDPASGHAQRPAVATLMTGIVGTGMLTEA